MKAKAIVLPKADTLSSKISNNGFYELVKSSRKYGNTFEIERFNAVTPSNLKGYLHSLENKGITWNYPFTKTEIDQYSGLHKHPYSGDPLVRMSCFMSHYLLWKECSEQDETYLILEHDAEFISKIEPDKMVVSNLTSIIGLNDPIQATRKSHLFHEVVMEGRKAGNSIIPVPRIDNSYIPQGLAGNSAYLITPSAAKEMLNLVKIFGMWPNDAIMCYQLFSRLFVTTKYYTRVQGLRSTTTV